MPRRHILSTALDNVTEETLSAITKAQTTGILENTGIYSYDLSGLVSLIPVVTPFRDIVSRTASPDGNPYAVWRAIMDLTNAQPDPSMGFDYAANEVNFLERVRPGQGVRGPLRRCHLPGSQPNPDRG
jgi:hypothetical protein